MNDSDTTAVNHGDNGTSKAARMLIPDPTKPLSLINPNDIPKKTPDVDEDDQDDESVSRR